LFFGFYIYYSLRGRIKIKVELGNFKELEDKIKGIVSEQVFLKKQVSILEEALKNKESEIEVLNSKLKALDGERDSVRARVDSLLDLLANIELAK
jgi:septal ring factor EnvC (AmiA/AmiB activator)